LATASDQGVTPGPIPHRNYAVQLLGTATAASSGSGVEGRHAVEVYAPSPLPNLTT
jgi:hypothetical protein